MKLQLPSEIDRRLNDAIKAEPDMLEQLKASYFETGRTVDDLILILSNKYKELTT